MASAKRDIRHIIDSFSEDLIQIAQDLARERVERAVTEWQAKNHKLLAKKSVEDERALRNREALERIERVALRRREREAKKAAERALRMEQRLIADSTEKPEKKRGRARRGGLLGDSAVSKEPTPPPLFVHKRRRDGEIQQLKRSDEDATTASNGGATNSSTPSVAPVVPEQLLLGL
jgi:hypothetical protein